MYSNEILEQMFSSNSDFKNIHFYVKRLKEINVDVSEYMEFYEKGDENERIEILNELDEIYKKLIRIEEISFDNGIAYVKMVYKKSFGLSDKKINKLFDNGHSIITYKILSWLTFIMLFVSFISFLSVIILFTINY